MQPEEFCEDKLSDISEDVVVTKQLKMSQRK